MKRNLLIGSALTALLVTLGVSQRLLERTATTRGAGSLSPSS